MQALKDVVDLTVLTWAPVRWSVIDRFFGTSLRQGTFATEVVPPRQRQALDLVPHPLDLVRMACLHAQARRLRRRAHFDVAVSTCNEAMLGPNTIQYIHFPELAPLNPADPFARTQRHPRIAALYRQLVLRAGGMSIASLRRNRSLANSDHVAAIVQQVYGIPPRVVHPPVPGGFPTVPWHSRSNRFVSIGRFHACKRIDEQIDIVAAVRARGHDVGLSIIGTFDAGQHFDEIRRRTAPLSWVSLHTALPRPAFCELVGQHRYGLHTMRDEPFGIAVVEMLRAGLVPFVHDSGGPRGIVAALPEVRFSDPGQAVESIVNVLQDDARQRLLASQCGLLAQDYSAEAYVETIRSIVLEEGLLARRR